MGTNKYCMQCGFELPSRQIRSCPECGAKFGARKLNRASKATKAKKCKIEDELKRFKKSKKISENTHNQTSIWKRIWPILVVAIVFYLAFYLISVISAQNALNYVVRICEESGIDSSNCSRAQSEKGVSCSESLFQIQCSKPYKVFTPFFYSY